MDILNPDLSQESFIQIAKDDIVASRVLFDAGKYSNSIYFLQQSVEKCCKYFGLTIKVIDADDLKKVGHNPHKIFGKIFNHSIMAIDGANVEFNAIVNEFEKLDASERIKYVVDNINIALSQVSIRIDDTNPVDAIIAFYDANPFSNLMQTNLVDEIKRCKKSVPIHILEKICIDHIKIINDANVAISCLMILSLLVWGIEEKIRYPDTAHNYSPIKVYTEDSDFVRNLPLFIDVQEKSTKSIFANFNGQ